MVLLPPFAGLVSTSPAGWLDPNDRSEEIKEKWRQMSCRYMSFCKTKFSVSSLMWKMLAFNWEEWATQGDISGESGEFSPHLSVLHPSNYGPDLGIAY